MKKSLLAGALAAILIASASVFSPTECLAAPPKHPPHHSVKAPRPSKPPAMRPMKPAGSMKPMKSAEMRRPPAMHRAGEHKRPPSFDRTGSKNRPPAMHRAGERGKAPSFDRAGDRNRPPAMRPMPSGKPNIGKAPSRPPTSGFDKHPSKPPTNGFDKRPSQPPTNGFDKRPSRPPTSGFDKRPSRPPTNGFDKHPNRPPHDIGGKHPANRPPHDIGRHHPPKPPRYRHHHHRYYFYSGLCFPAFYGGYYYGAHYSDPSLIMYGITVCPADHPNIFLLNRMLANNLYSENDFAVFYNGQTALDYDAEHGTGAFYHLAIENAPDIKKWKSQDADAQPTFRTLDEYLTKYHFVPSTDTLFDGKHLYKFDPDISAFVENQTIEGLTNTYKHGKFHLICASPQGELPKYYLVLKDAIYETQYTCEADCPDLRELNRDTKRLWKLLK